MKVAEIRAKKAAALDGGIVRSEIFLFFPRQICRGKVIKNPINWLLGTWK